MCYLCLTWNMPSPSLKFTGQVLPGPAAFSIFVHTLCCMRIVLFCLPLFLLPAKSASIFVVVTPYWACSMGLLHALWSISLCCRLLSLLPPCKYRSWAWRKKHVRVHKNGKVMVPSLKLMFLGCWRPVLFFVSMYPYVLCILIWFIVISEFKFMLIRWPDQIQPLHLHPIPKLLFHNI